MHKDYQVSYPQTQRANYTGEAIAAATGTHKSEGEGEMNYEDFNELARLLGRHDLATQTEGGLTGEALLELLRELSFQVQDLRYDVEVLRQRSEYT